MAKQMLHKASNEEGTDVRLFFFCPGCKSYHAFRIKGESGPVWSWNGLMDNPTFSPSLLVYGNTLDELRCHSFVKDGKIQFLNDCHHDLKNQTIPIPERDWDW